MPEEKPKKKSPILAAILSFFIPGLGQAYKREYGLGLLMFLAALGVDAIILFFFFPEMPFTLLSWAVMLVSAWDAYTGKISAGFYAGKAEEPEEAEGEDEPHVQIIPDDRPGVGPARITTVKRPAPKPSAAFAPEESHAPPASETGRAPPESSEKVLVRTLYDLARSSGYYGVSDITAAMAERYPEKQSWLSSEWVGRALERLGFTEKRRMRGGVEVLLDWRKVRDVAREQGVIHGGY